MNLYLRFKRMITRPSRPDPAKALATFRLRYDAFRRLLESNAEILRVLGEFDEAAAGRGNVTPGFAGAMASRAVFHATRLAEALSELSGGRHKGLRARARELGAQVAELLSPVRAPADSPLSLPLSAVRMDMVPMVGGKAAKLGEAGSLPRLSVPAGFAMTTRACSLFLDGLGDGLASQTAYLDPDDAQSVEKMAQAVQLAILKRHIPEEIVTALDQGFTELARSLGVDAADLRVAVRSSAIGEDEEASFAGQYASVLAVDRDRLPSAWRMVVASLFTARALAYRARLGLAPHQALMGVLCLTHVSAESGGVAYSLDPVHSLDDCALVAAHPGLPVAVVDGTATADRFQVCRGLPMTVTKSEIAHKTFRMDADEAGGLTRTPLPPEAADRPSLSAEQALLVAQAALALEQHFGQPQDIEFAFEKGRLVILQSRPLHVPPAPAAKPPELDLPLLLQGAEPASSGQATGLVVHARPDGELAGIPEGAVLVSPQSSPIFALVMPRISAIVTEAGSAAGHMAAVAREMGVPALVGARRARELLPPGRMVTVDGYRGRVHDGALDPDQLVRPERTRPPSRLLADLRALIVPLTLVDPSSPDFLPPNCRTLHDVARFGHEFAYREMFTVSDALTRADSEAEETQGHAKRLVVNLPFDIRVIDLGGGLSAEASEAHEITPGDVGRGPFASLLTGLTDPRLRHHEPRPVNLRGLGSVFSQQMFTPPKSEGQRFGDASYAVVGSNYLNFSSRVGYHYSVLDAFVGPDPVSNIITFGFAGGAADPTRRGRRIRCIELILDGLSFTTRVRGDRLDAKAAKLGQDRMLQILTCMGRLLVFTRQMDMLMNDDDAPARMAESFGQEDYCLDRMRDQPNPANGQ